MNDNLQHKDALTFCLRARTIGLYGFILFLPCSIAFTQMCLGLLALTHLVEAGLTRNFRFPHTPLNWPLFGYIAVMLVTTMFSHNVPKSIRASKGLLVIATFYLFYMYVKDVAQAKRFAGLLILFVSITAFYGIVQHFLEVDLFRISRPISFLKHINNDLTAPVRIPGFFSTYMTFSGQLAMTIPIIFACLLCLKGISKKLLLTISLILTGLAIIWTYTRSAWIGAISALTLLGYMKEKRLAILFLLILILFVTVTITQPDILEQNLLDRSLSVISAKENMDRIYTWISTLEMIKDHPLTGIGMGTYSKVSPEYRRGDDVVSSSLAHAHNNILQAAVEGGVFSAFFILWLWGVIFKELYRTYTQIPEEKTSLKWLSLGLLGAIIAFFVQGLFENNFGDSESVMMMWFITALSLKLQILVTAKQS